MSTVPGPAGEERPTGREGFSSAAVDVACRILGELAERDTPIGPLTTYRVGGSAAVLVRACRTEDLRLVGRAMAASGLPALPIGLGSNLLIADAGFPGIAIVLDDAEEAFGAVHVVGRAIRAGGAVPLPVLGRRSSGAGLTGLEWAVGVPGSVGGALRMNAGGHGSDVAATLRRARVADLTDGGRVVSRTASDLQLGYRRSALRWQHVVVEAEFALRPGDPAASRETIREIVRWRREHQPGGQNAGSVFTNPPEGSAGWLIESAGLKGYRSGSAMVSPKHANFIQADPGGSADDVRDLLEHVRAAVHQRFGVWLHPENQLIGFEHARPGGQRR
jgi:UDP-N-acetylmuramate dehydrogenase